MRQSTHPTADESLSSVDSWLPEDTQAVTDRLLTVPNLLSLVRLLALPFVYADLVGGREGRALLLLVLVSSSDAADGFVARRFNQVSRIGRLMDPLSDRLLLGVVGVGLVVAHILPLWAVLLLVARDVLVSVGLVVLLKREVPAPSVSDLGKAATFGLMFVLALLLVARVTGFGSLRIAGYVLYAAFVCLYYLAATQYALAVRALMRNGGTDPAAAS